MVELSVLAGRKIPLKVTTPFVLSNVCATHPRGFFLSPLNQQESGPSRKGNLNYILCGNFDEKKSRGTSFR